MSDAPRFRFGPLERRGVLLGLRVQQLAVLIAGATVAVVILRVLEGSASLVASFAAAGLTLIVCFAPVRGLSFDEWLPLAVSGWMRRATGRDRFLSDAPSGGGYPAAIVDSMREIIILSHDVPGASAPIGIAKDRRQGTFTGVLSVRGSSFTLADADEKSRRLASWGGILSGLAREGGLVHRLQWVERTVPDTADRVAEHLRDNLAVPLDSPLARSYLEVIDGAGPTTQEHEVFLALAVDAARAAKAIKAAGGGDEGACEVVRRELTALSASLMGCDVAVEGALTPRLLARAFRSAFDPEGRRGLAAIASRDPDREGSSVANAGPMAADTSWTTYRTDTAWHATYWIAEWPRIGVDADFLAPLLLRTTCSRSVSLTLDPISPLKAIRSVESARTSVTADEELRDRAGFLTTMRRQREHEALADNERDLTDGHAFYRFAGFVTVSAATEEELEVACGEVEDSAARCFLDLRRFYGQQDEAFTYTLPLCRGLR